MAEINLKKKISGSVDEVVERVTKLLAAEGFGVLTRIDFDKKIKEKLNQDMKPLVILGACNPQLAYEAFLRNSDITSLVPCNVVVREVSENQVSVEMVMPTALMKMLGDEELVALSADADLRLGGVLEAL